MTADPVLVTVSHWEVIVGFVITMLFPLVILRWWPWYKSAWGWNIVLLEASIAATLLPSFIFALFHVYDLFLQWLSVICFGMVIAVIVWRTVIIRNTQIEDTKAEYAADRDRTPAAADADGEPAGK